VKRKPTLFFVLSTLAHAQGWGHHEAMDLGYEEDLTTPNNSFATGEL